MLYWQCLPITITCILLHVNNSKTADTIRLCGIACVGYVPHA